MAIARVVAIPSMMRDCKSIQRSQNVMLAKMLLTIERLLS
jgi:hypothetical protein